MEGCGPTQNKARATARTKSTLQSRIGGQACGQAPRVCYPLEPQAREKHGTTEAWRREKFGTGNQNRKSLPQIASHQGWLDPCLARINDNIQLWTIRL
jgi:hypothetical protein